MNVRTFLGPLLVALGTALAAPVLQAQSDRPHRGAPPRAHPAPRPAPPPRHFDHDWDRGYWHHGWHADHFGWWWVVGPSWYFYSVPVYPYWYAYPPPVRVIEEPAPSGPPPTPYWYWCDDPRGYYPYVPQCPGGWTPVPATPPDAPKP